MPITSAVKPPVPVSDHLAGTGLPAKSRASKRWTARLARTTDGGSIVIVSACDVGAVGSCVAAGGATGGAAAVAAGVTVADAVRFAQKLTVGAFDVAFADPPYSLGVAPKLAAIWLETPFATTIGIEHSVHEPLPDGGERRTYGDTAITIYRSES